MLCERTHNVWPGVLHVHINRISVTCSYSNICYFFDSAASSLSEIDVGSSDMDEYNPKLVRTINRRRFDKALRTIHELCQWGAKEGLKMLSNIHKVFI